jgi:hypothetical protein
MTWWTLELFVVMMAYLIPFLNAGPAGPEMKRKLVRGNAHVDVERSRRGLDLSVPVLGREVWVQYLGGGLKVGASVAPGSDGAVGPPPKCQGGIQAAGEDPLYRQPVTSIKRTS